MHHRKLLENLKDKPYYLYCDIQDIAVRISIIEGEVEVFVKHRESREFKAVYDSRVVGLALSDEPTAITKEQYDDF